MTNFTNSFKPYEMKVWENGSTWQRARIAYRHECMSELASEELNEILETVSEQNFYAEMSDDFSVTCKEKRENNAIAQAARELLNVRS